MKAQYFLTAMGIQTWRSRQPVPGAKVTLHCKAFKLFSDELMYGYLLLDWRNDFIVDEKKIYNLLTAMLNSVGLRYSNIEYDENNFLKENSKILIMGSTPKNLMSASSKIIITQHPKEILNNPLLKAQVWNDLLHYISN